ncbi:hypothetical protein [Amycolatopsis sp. NPDC051903]|uniref:hypothetical protein n=1 Tax=Amycolatopsis sp. NPDC051903 TaxID=3363936 RepID=UPI00378CC0F9
MTEPDVDAMIRALLCQGRWRFVPQLTYQGSINALMRVEGSTTDLITLPEEGWSAVVRLRGGPDSRGSFRRTGIHTWRHMVPLEVALRWALRDQHDDAALVFWLDRTLQRVGDGPHHGSLS